MIRYKRQPSDVELSHRVWACANRYTQYHGQEPTLRHVAATMGLTMRRVVELCDIYYHPHRYLGIAVAAKVGSGCFTYRSMGDRLVEAY